MLNRRHKAILFVTLVVTGTALLAGASLGEGLGTLILGGALAWVAGSETASRTYDYMRRLPSEAWAWIRVPLLTSICGCVLAAVAIWANFNTFLVCAAMALLGMFISPLAHVPTRRRWLKGIVWMVAVALSFLSTVGITMLNEAARQNAERVGQLWGYGLIALLIGIFWLVKGWELILAGIKVQPPTDPDEPIRNQKGTKWLHLSLFGGTIVLTLWLGLLVFSAFSDSGVSSQVMATSPPSANPLSPVIFLMFLAWWPFASWRSILEREPNASVANVKRHKRTTMLLGALFTVVLSVAITFGIQNSNDRISTAEVERGTKDFQEGRDLRTTKDYIDAYGEIDPLQSDFDGRLQRFTEILHQAQERERSRGPFNVQRLNGSKEKEWLSWDFSTFDVFRQDSELTRKQVLVVKQMGELPEQEQAAFWEKNFRPLLEEETTIRQKLMAAMANSPDKRK